MLEVSLSWGAFLGFRISHRVSFHGCRWWVVSYYFQGYPLSCTSSVIYSAAPLSFQLFPFAFFLLLFSPLRSCKSWGSQWFYWHGSSFHDLLNDKYFPLVAKNCLLLHLLMTWLLIVCPSIWVIFKAIYLRKRKTVFACDPHSF